jgi:hypothetical protein
MGWITVDKGITSYKPWLGIQLRFLTTANTRHMTILNFGFSPSTVGYYNKHTQFIYNVQRVISSITDTPVDIVVNME